MGFTFFAQFLTMGTLFYAFGPLLKPLTVALDADRFEVSLALSIQSAVAALAGPWVGKLVAERSIRVLMLTGAAMLLLGFLAMGQARNVWHLYLSYGLVLGWAMALAGPIPTNTLLANWFDRRRGMAFGIAGFGISISGTVVIPVTSWMLLEYDWQTAVTSFGIAAFAILVPLTVLFAVKRPEDRGLLPDNAEPGSEDAAGSFPEDPAGARHWTFLRAVRDRRIWNLVVIIGTSFLGIGGVLLALHSHMTDIGLSAMQAASVMAVLTFMGAIAKPLFGITADYINKRLAMGISLCCQIAGLSLIMAFESQLGLTLAVVVFGLGYRRRFAALVGAAGCHVRPGCVRAHHGGDGSAHHPVHARRHAVYDMVLREYRKLPAGVCDTDWRVCDFVCGADLAAAAGGGTSSRRVTKGCVSGAPGATRTHGLWLRRPTLYPTELRARGKRP